MTEQINILDRIVKDRQKRVRESAEAFPLARVRELAEEQPPPLSFRWALVSRPGIAVISEMKRSSPSAGLLDSDLVPAERARMYCSAGAAAISVLTEYDYFQGTLDDLREVKEVAGGHNVAVLQKDFIIDEYQVFEARAAGADAVLLIVSILDRHQYRDLFQVSMDLGMDVLVEVFDERELEMALELEPPVVGVNNRNLRTLDTSLRVFERVARLIPRGKIKVAESGMKKVDDVRRMAYAGANAVLVGESLMKAGEDAAELVARMAEIR